MKVSQRIGLLLFLISQLSLCGFAQHGIITTYAGSNSPVTGARAVTQAIAFPHGVAADGVGGFYVSSPFQNRIYRVSADGAIYLTAGVGSSGFSGDGGLATAAQLNEPIGVTVDSAGNIFISDSGNNRIRKITPMGLISTVAGNGTYGFSGDGGLATAAQLKHPCGIAVDSAANLYIADRENQRIRKVAPVGIISTVAGNGDQGSSGDGGLATAVNLNRPTGVAVDSAGNLFIADTHNHRIRKVTTAGIISTVAGGGTRGLGDGGLANEAQLNEPIGVAVDSAGNLYIVGNWTGRIRKVTTAGIISTVAGGGTRGLGDKGLATAAQLTGLNGMSIDSAGNLFIVDTGNNRIRKVTTAGIINTVAGNGNRDYNDDGGLATTAQLNGPRGIAIDPAGNLYISDSGNNRIRKVTAAGIISTVLADRHSGVVNTGEEPAIASTLYLPGSVSVDSVGNLYVADRVNNQISKVTTAGAISTVAGKSIMLSEWTAVHNNGDGDGGLATAAQLISPMGMTVDSAGNLFIADTYHNRIRKVTTAGIISTVAGGGTRGLGDGGLATEAQLKKPYNVAIDSAGNLFIADSENNRIRKVTTAGIISTVAGGGTRGLGDGSRATTAKLNRPTGVAFDSAGNLYIADSGNNRIRKVTTAGIISTVAGGGPGDLGDGGLATTAKLRNPVDVAIDSAGNLFIADYGNNRIRKVTQ